MTANQIFEVETNIGEPIFYEGGRLIPYSRSLVLRNPWSPNLVVWNRPAAILVKKNDGQEQVIPVVDVTRRLQIAVFIGAMLGALLVWLGTRKRL